MDTTNKIFISQKDGFLRQLTEEEYWKININYFRTRSHDNTINLVNEDTKNIIPYIKDILNRKHKFIEILYLKVIFWFLVLIIVMTSINVYYIIKAQRATEQNNWALQNINWNIDGINKTIKINKPL